jgi:hypothetical protein
MAAVVESFGSAIGWSEDSIVTLHLAGRNFMKTKRPLTGVGQIWPPSPIIYAPNADEKLWRYMDFTKFVSLLDQSALYLPSANMFNDNWEGSYPARDSFAKAGRERIAVDRLAKLVKDRENFKNRCFISCWHLSEYESAAMWMLYKSGDVGVAVQTTYGLLREAIGGIDAYRRSYQLWFPKVIYIDYETETFEGHVAEVDITPFFHKRKSFEHEKEFRIIITSIKEHGSGFKLKVSLSTLLSKVYISPNAPEWFKELVISVLQKYNLSSVPVHHTDLDKDPIY